MRFKMKILLMILMILLINSSNILANNYAIPDISKNELNRHKIGAVLSPIAGIGLGYNYKITNNFAIEAVGSYFSDNWLSPSSYNTHKFYSAGGELQYYLLNDDNFEFYFCAGASFNHNVNYKQYELESQKRVLKGIGCAVSYKITDYLLVNFKPTYYTEDIDGRFMSSTSMIVYSPIKQLVDERFERHFEGLVFGLALYYSF